MKDLAALFLKLGITGFGGPPAHLEMMRREVVENRKWVTEQELLDMIGAANLVPGPNSTEVAMHIGYRRAGWKGLMVAGLCFILPAAAITALSAFLYVSYGELPRVHDFADGLKAGVFGIMVVSGVRLARPAVKTAGLAAIGLGSGLLSVVGLPEALVLMVAGIAGIVAATAATKISISPLPIFLFFLQVGATIYGGGFVLVSYLQTGLVDQLGWLSQDRLLDAIAVGQVTPGPVFSTATFVGYLLGGSSGAAAATTGIFLPSFLFVGFLGLITRWMRQHPKASAFLDGVTVASVALIFAAAMKLGPAALRNPADWILGTVVLILGLSTRLNPGLLVIGAGLARLGLSSLGLL